MATSSSIPIRPMLGIDVGTKFCRAVCMFNPSRSNRDLMNGFFDTNLLTAIRLDNSSSDHTKVEIAWSTKLNRWIWGNQVEKTIENSESLEISEADRIFLIKLALDDESNESRDIRKKVISQIDKLPEHLGIRTPDQLMVAYLKLFLEDAMRNINLEFKRLIDTTQISPAHLDTIITVPAAWSIRLRHKMMKIASDAGLQNIRFPVAEPDAAALCMRYDEQHRFGNTPASHGSSLVLDLGAGTGDIASFNIQGGSLSHAVAPTEQSAYVPNQAPGSHYGSSMLNYHFVNLVEGILKRQRKAILKQWREEKAFRGYPAKDIPEEELWEEIKSYVWKKFEGAKEDVGEDFEERSEDRFAIRLHDIRVQLPRITSPVLVAKGSIIRSLRRDAIKTTRMSQSLGTAWDEEYDARDHGSNARTVIDPCDGAEVVEDCITWLVRKVPFQALPRTSALGLTLIKNEDLQYDEKPRVLEGGWKLVPTEGVELMRQIIFTSRTQTHDHLCVSDPSNGKEKFHIGVTSHLTSIQTDIVPAGFIDLYLTEKERRLFPIWHNDEGEEWHELEYRIRVTFEESVVRYEFIVPRHGKACTPADWETNVFIRSAVLETDTVFAWGEQSFDETPNGSDSKFKPQAPRRGHEERRFRAPNMVRVEPMDEE
ncbi:uncharacterized protein KY384_007882 [Bacidia gigantensis]|uniref:uncharacterized protein n=1 Tax=Bacidia gigantensis TaxID=2732470 RepID=UPI001D0597FE|nr:uncharacterized protein KY384_007882 [Bacidia gigantensis]KAG8527728.1 hypothetical protein KY384_007882 [Bacidia gigantensis]